MTVQQILDYVNSLAPVHMKADWDNVGLLCGRRDQEVKKILVALDPFMDVCEEAAAVGAEVSVSVSVEESGNPVFIRITGNLSREQRQQLQSAITNDLGIPGEAQEWITTKENRP